MAKQDTHRAMAVHRGERQTLEEMGEIFVEPQQLPARHVLARGIDDDDDGRGIARFHRSQDYLAGGVAETCFQADVPLVPLLLPVCHGAVPQIPEPTVRGAWAAFPDRPVESEDLSDYPRELLAIAHKI